MSLSEERAFIEKKLYIRTKDARLKRLKLNAPQRRLYQTLLKQKKAGRPQRVIILKARQMGFSTLAEAMIFTRTVRRRNVNSLIVAHREDSTGNLFKMSRLFLERLPEEDRPMVKNSNARELVFENPSRDMAQKAAEPGLMSRIRCNTAGSDGLGRSDTLHNVHASEFAFWKGDKAAIWVGIMQAVPSRKDTMVIVESTANGFDEFHRMWEQAVRGESDFEPLFFPWFENREYRMKVSPGTEWTQAERDMAEEYGLDEQQLQWRRWCIQNNCAGDEIRFKQEYPACPDEAFVTGGQHVFDNELAALQRSRAPEPEDRGDFAYERGEDPTVITGIRWQSRREGLIRIYEKPVKGRPYVIGGDTAGTGGDWFTAQVLDNTSGRQVAVLRHQFDEDLYARQLYCLGLFYNGALVGVETNYSTYPVRMLEMMGYPKQYVREKVDDFTGELQTAYGFATTSRTRPLIVAGLVQAFREEPGLVVDKETLGEMLSFQYNEKRRPEAIRGEHDDLVMALAIAHYIRSQQDYADEPGPEPRRRWTKDMRQDYENAGEEGRRLLIKLWGRPL